MLSRFYLLICILLSTVAPVVAGDFANREIIGFSKDGTLFAFEQYGVQDGSGFPYSEIYVIDTRTDNWVEGSPFRSFIRSEDAKLATVRADVRQQAESALESITDPGIIAASNRADERVSDPYTISVVPRTFYLSGGNSHIEFTVETIPFAANEQCKGVLDNDKLMGFKLTRSDSNAANNLVVMHEDKSVPASRHCPLDYKPADVIFHYSEGGKYTIAVLVQMETFGFEGRDGRYLAVTGSLN